MPTRTGADPQDIPGSVCLELLRGARIGRVVYTDGAVPVATPVNYALDGDAVVFRARAGSRLAMATSGVVVSFQVDRVDEDTASGWSVIVTGLSEVLLGSARMRAEQLAGVSWAGDDRNHVVRVPPTLVSGCQIGPHAVELPHR